MLPALDSDLRRGIPHNGPTSVSPAEGKQDSTERIPVSDAVVGLRFDVELRARKLKSVLSGPGHSAFGS